MGSGGAADDGVEQHHQQQQQHDHQHHPTATVTWREASGALGDLGTFLPPTVALAAPPLSVDLGTTLLFSGLYHIASGCFTRIPVCIQPMKAIAALALTGELTTPAEVAAAGLCVGAVMLLAGVTGAMDVLAAACPLSIVRGIQLGVGLQLAQRGIASALLLPQQAAGGGGGWRAWLGVDGLLLGLAATGFLLVTTLPHRLPLAEAPGAASGGGAAAAAAAGDKSEEEEEEEEEQLPLAAASAAHSVSKPAAGATAATTCGSASGCSGQASPAATAAAAAAAGGAAGTGTPTFGCDGCTSSSTSSTSSTSRVPSALLIVLLGLLLSVASHPGVLAELRLGPSPLRLHVPSTQELQAGAKAALAQLPLTSLNSVVAVSQLARELFPQRMAADGWRWRPGVVACGVGAINLVGCWFQAMPCCSGAGGLAAQVKFGAQYGAAPVMLGGAKVLLALLFGSSLLQLLQRFPQPLLGAMLLAAGLELAASARQTASDPRGFAFTLLTAGAILGLRSTAAGFAVGCGCCAAAAASEAVSQRSLSWQRQQPGAAGGAARRRWLLPLYS